MIKSIITVDARKSVRACIRLVGTRALNCAQTTAACARCRERMYSCPVVTGPTSSGGFLCRQILTLQLAGGRPGSCQVPGSRLQATAILRTLGRCRLLRQRPVRRQMHRSLRLGLNVLQQDLHGQLSRVSACHQEERGRGGQEWAVSEPATRPHSPRRTSLRSGGAGLRSPVPSPLRVRAYPLYYRLYRPLSSGLRPWPVPIAVPSALRTMWVISRIRS